MSSANIVYSGDNLYILNAMDSESIDLIYLDPPFNSKRIYTAAANSKTAGITFKDIWTWQNVNQKYFQQIISAYPGLKLFIKTATDIHGKAMAAYLAYMAQRIVPMQRVLKASGSLYLHCDPTASHYLKVILDYIFGVQNFRNEIVWCYRTGGASTKTFGRKHDLIYFYTKSNKYNFNIPKQKSYLSGQLKHTAKHKTYEDEYGCYQNILFSKTNIKLYKDEKGYYTMTACRDYWHIDAVGRSAKERTGYPTQKPLALLERIIKASSNPDGVVLDPFCGCATTLVAADDLQREWIGIDISKKAAELVVSRIEDRQGLFRDITHRTDIPKRTDLGKVPSYNSPENRKKLYGEQGGDCNGCGTHFEPRHFEIDHIISRNKGGTDHIENLQLLCGSCNRIKGDRGMEYLKAKLQL